MALSTLQLYITPAFTQESFKKISSPLRRVVSSFFHFVTVMAMNRYFCWPTILKGATDLHSESLRCFGLTHYLATRSHQRKRKHIRILHPGQKVYTVSVYNSETICVCSHIPLSHPSTRYTPFHRPSLSRYTEYRRFYLGENSFRSGQLFYVTYITGYEDSSSSAMFFLWSFSFNFNSKLSDSVC